MKKASKENGPIAKTAKSKKRLIYVDYLRALSSIAVIFLHIILNWSEKSNLLVAEYPVRLKIDAAIAGILRCAVPIFVMISGALLLNSQKNITWKKIAGYITRMLLILATFGYVFCIIENITNHIPIPNTFGVAFTNLIQEKTWGHLWYVYMLIGIYILTPIIKKFTDKCTRDEFKNALIALATVSIIIPSINWITGLNITVFRLFSYQYIFYYLLGQYLERYQIKKRLGVYGLLATIVLVLLEVFTEHHITGNHVNSIPVAIISAFIFTSFKNRSFRPSAIIKIVSRNSFAIYLVHMFWIHVLEIGFNYDLKNTWPVIGEIGELVGILLLSIISSEILRRLPVIRRLL